MAFKKKIMDCNFQHKVAYLEYFYKIGNYYFTLQLIIYKQIVFDRLTYFIY
jgi:hypothetical protein